MNQILNVKLLAVDFELLSCKEDLVYKKNFIAWILGACDTYSWDEQFKLFCYVLKSLKKTTKTKHS